MKIELEGQRANMKKIEYCTKMELGIQKEEIKKLKIEIEAQKEKNKELDEQKEETEQLKSEVRFLKVVVENLLKENARSDASPA